MYGEDAGFSIVKIGVNGAGNAAFATPVDVDGLKVGVGDAARKIEGSARFGVSLKHQIQVGVYANQAPFQCFGGIFALRPDAGVFIAVNAQFIHQKGIQNN